jgi:hypothetical protein
MKIKNKIFILLGVFTLVGLTHSFTLKDLNAALTKPASYDIQYSYYSAGGGNPNGHRYASSTDTNQIVPRYTRSTDGAYYNYTHTLIGSDTSAGGLVPLGLDITHTFNRSNTSWSSASPSGYHSTDTKIGSNNTVGAVKKMILTFNNQTNKDYKLFFDSSSTTSYSFTYFYYYVNASYGYDQLYFYHVNEFLTTFLVPAFTNFKLESNNVSGLHYFDAWYLKDLGVSASYDAGYDAGYEQGDIDGYADGLGNNPNVLLSGFQAMVGILVNFMLMILNLEVFGVSIMSVFGILALFVGVIWILKIVRG